jgi:GntR family transcriptional regulator, transcriptional repressor for pyruvate dehydrogenase complex
VPRAAAEPRRASDQVFAGLLEALLSGRYAPGEKLPAQRTLAAEAGVTMGTVREALQRLEQMGLLEVRQGDAMRVRDWRRHGGLDVIAHLALTSGRFDPAVLGDVLEARGLMLRELATLAARRRSAEQAGRLGDLAAAVSQAPDDQAAQRLDFAFFTELAEAAGNLVFALIMNSIRSLYFEHAERLPVTAAHEELAPLYVETARAVRRRRPSAARRAVGLLAERQRERVEAASR